MKLADYLKRCQQAKRQENSKKRNYFYISEAGKRPYHIFKSMISKKRLPPRILGLMQIGRTMHRQTYDQLSAMGFLKAKEIKVGDSLFRGYVDAIIHLPGEKPMPLEIKTIGARGFNILEKQNRPYWQSYIQLQLYLNYLRKMSQGRILYIEVQPFNSSTQRMKEFLVSKNPKIIRQTIAAFRKLKTKFQKAGVMAK